MGLHFRSITRISLRARWLGMGVIFYFLVVGLLVLPELRENHLRMERTLQKQMKGLAVLAASELAQQTLPLDGPVAIGRLRESLLDYPGFDYAVLELNGRPLWTVLNESAPKRVQTGQWSVPASGGPPGQIIEIEPHPLGWLHLTGHLFEVSVPVDARSSPGHVLRLGMDTAMINQQLVPHLWIAGSVALLMALVGAGLAAGMDRSIKGRLQELISATRALADEGSGRVEIRTGDELEALGDSFNAMAERLHSREDELRSVQRTLQSIFDCINTGITYISSDYRIVMANKFQGSIFGKDPGAFAGRECFAEFEKRSAVCGHCPGALAMADGRSHSVETEAVLDDGRRVPVLINAYPVRDGSGKVAGFVEHVEDITKWKQMEETLRSHGQNLEGLVAARTRELMEAQAQVLHSAKLASLGEMVGGVAHEINNPIAIMVARLEVLMAEMDETISPELSRDFEVLLKHAKRIGGITSKLLAFSRMSSPHKHKAQVPPVLEEAAELVEAQFAKRGVEILRSVDPGLPEAMVDRGQMLQVFLNLLNNAADAISGPGRIELGCVTNNVNGKPWIEVLVEDSGPGVPPEIRDRIFDPFFTTKGVGEGTGLGLSVSYGIVADHGGDISVADGEHGGARFVVRIPAAGPGQGRVEEVP